MKLKLAFIVLAILTANLVNAATPTTITCTWTYSGDRATLGGFNVYLGSNKVCTTTDPQATGLTCSVLLTVGANTFNMTAFNREGVEGGISAPFILQNHDPVPGIPTGLNVIKK